MGCSLRIQRAGCGGLQLPGVCGETPADYDVCRSTTGYKQGNFEASQVPAGQNLCVKTNDSRYSAIKVIRIDKSELVIDVVTYDPPFTNG